MRKSLAKVNLCLHITGKQADGYHLLESLTAFADVGEQLSVGSNAPSGKAAHYFHDAPSNVHLYVRSHIALDKTFGSDNLIFRAARALQHACLPQQLSTAHITLDKHIPLGAGLGGGSSNAAAAMQLLNDYWQCGLNMQELTAIAAAMGSDLVACLAAQPCWMLDTGNRLEPCSMNADLWLVLAHPGIMLSSADVYRRLQLQTQPQPPRPKAFKSAKELLDFLTHSRNDLTTPAAHIAPEIEILLAALRALPGASLARMTGSGSACFALFHSKAEAQNGAALLKAKQPEWWVRSARLEPS